MARLKHIFWMVYGAILYVIFFKFIEWLHMKALPYIGYYAYHPAPFKWHEPYDVNKCQCVDNNGNPLRQCHECPR